MSDKRLLKDTKIEIRKLDDEKEVMHIEGKAVAFDSPETYYGETEVIDKNAFANTDMSDVVLRYNHNDTQYTLARTRNNSLRIDVREDGVYFEADLIDTTTNQDAYKMIQAGLLDKCSFAFSVGEDDYDAENHLRTILSISKLYDLSVVDVPFYSDTFVEARNLDNRIDYLEKAKELQTKAYNEKKEKLLNEIKRKELLQRL